MFGILFKVNVKAEKRQAFLDFIAWDIRVAKEREPGTLRFDLYQDLADENAFFVYEAYRDKKAFAEHQKNLPYQQWESQIRPEMVTGFQLLFEGDEVCSLADKQPTNDNIRTAYEALCRSHQAIDDFRAKLLALFPLASGAGLFLLLQDKTKLEPQWLFPIGIFGFLITIGIYLYELRGVHRCTRLITVAKELERLMGVEGQFRRIPPSVGGFINEPIAAGFIYSAVFGGWAFVATVPFLPGGTLVAFCEIPLGLAIILAVGVFLVGLASAVGFYRHVRKDSL